MNTFKSVFITGGTGTFGRAFTRFLLGHPAIERVCIYSRGEHAQAAMAAEFNNDYRLRFMLGDVRDKERLTRAMRGCDAVVHAAALKRIETGAYNPDEMVKTNVHGAMNVIDAAFAAHVRYVVGLSTDKAYAPISPYGQTKAIAESLFLTASTVLGGIGPRFAVARYGNIWNAQGSVVPKWLEMRANGATHVPITDPDCTRFFMTIDEACRLIWDLLCEMDGGELVIPDWLPAYRLGDLTIAMCMPTHIVGLPKWEKLHESMRHDLHSNMVRRMSISELRKHLKHI